MKNVGFMKKIILSLSLSVAAFLLPLSSHAAFLMERVAIPDTDFSLEVPADFAINKEATRNSVSQATGSGYVVLINKAGTVSIVVSETRLGIKKEQMNAYKDILVKNRHEDNLVVQAIQLDKGLPAWLISYKTRYHHYRFNNVDLLTSQGDKLRIIDVHSTDKLMQEYKVSEKDILLSIKFNGR